MVDKIIIDFRKDYLKKKEKVKNYLKWIRRPGNVKLQEIYNKAMGLNENGEYDVDYIYNYKNEK